MDDFKSKYKKIADEIKPSEELKRNIIESSYNYKKSKIQFLSVPVIALIIFAIGIPVMGSMGYLDVIKDILGKNENVELLTNLEEQNICDIKDNVKIKVEGGVIGKAGLSFYVTAEDLTGKRIGKESKFIESNLYYNNSPLQITSITEKGFDKKNNKAIFKIEGSFENNLKKGENLKLELKGFLSDFTEYKNVQLPVKIDNNIEIVKSNDDLFSQSVYVYADEDELKKADAEFPDSDNNILVPSDYNEKINNIDFMSVNGAKFIGDKLYINIAFNSKAEARTTVMPYIIDSKGNKIECLYANGVVDNRIEKNYDSEILTRDYCQFVFNISQKEFEKAKVYCDISYYNTEINDSFILNINTENILNNVIEKENVPFESETIKYLEITPFYILGVINNFDCSFEKNYYGEIIYSNGKKEKLDNCFIGDNIYKGDGGFTVYTEKYIDIEKIDEIIINGVSVYKK